ASCVFPLLSCLAFRWKRLHEGARKPEPARDRSLSENRRINKDVALHGASTHFHYTRARTRERRGLRVLADPRQETAPRGRDQHVAIEHEAYAAKHLDLASGGIGERGTHGGCDGVSLHARAPSAAPPAVRPRRANPRHDAPARQRARA